MKMTAPATDSTPSSWLARVKAGVGPRGGLALLVVAHFVLTVLQSWPLPAQIDRWIGPSPFGTWEFLTAASEAVLNAQVAMIAVYLVLGGGLWLARMVRGAVLLLWFVLAQLAGTHLLDAGRDARGFQEFLAHYVWMLAFFCGALLFDRLISRRRITLPNVPASRKPAQFRILHLLLITAEVAAAMAAIRALVAWESDWRTQLWEGLRNYPISFMSFEMTALALLSTIPPVLVTVRFRSVRRAALALGIWEFLLSTGFVAYNYFLPDSGAFPLAAPDAPGWLWACYWLNIFVFCCTTSFVVWLTLAIVRLLGYDFLPLPRRGGGRQSSDATSAA